MFKKKKFHPIVVILSIGLALTSCQKLSAQIHLRGEPSTLSRDQLLKQMKEHQLHCPGEKINGKLANQFETVVLRDARVINDHATGLMWQQEENPDRLTWKGAEGYIKKMNESKFAGYNDWRLPTAIELASLLQKKKSGQFYIHKVFKKGLLNTWTSDIVKDAFAGAWFVDFHSGKPIDGNRMAGLGHVRIVRSMK